MSSSVRARPDEAGREAGCRAGVREHTEGTVIDVPKAVTLANQIERTLGRRRLDEVVKKANLGAAVDFCAGCQF